MAGLIAGAAIGVAIGVYAERAFDLSFRVQRAAARARALWAKRPWAKK